VDYAAETEARAPLFQPPELAETLFILIINLVGLYSYSLAVSTINPVPGKINDADKRKVKFSSTNTNSSTPLTAAPSPLFGNAGCRSVYKRALCLSFKTDTRLE
jgi:hypothetical protein